MLLFQKIKYLIFIIYLLMKNNIVVTLTGRDGRITKLEQVYLRGGQIKFIVLPDSLKQSPIFKKVQQISKQKKERDLAAVRGRGAKRMKK